MNENTSTTDSTAKPPDSGGAQSASGLLWRLTGATFNYGIGQVLPQVIGFFLIPVYTAFLTPVDYGILDLASNFVVFLVIIMQLGVPGAVSRFYYDHTEGPGLRNYVSTIFIFMLFTSMTMAVITLAISPLLVKSIIPGLSFWFILLAVISAAAGCGSSLQRRLIQAREQSGYSARLSVVFALTGIGLALLFVAGFRWGVLGMLLSQAITAVLFFFQALMYLRKDIAGKFHPEILKSSLVFALGILPGQLMGTIAPLFTRSILAHAASLAAVGMLGIATRFTQPLSLLVSAFNNAYIPVYFSVRNENSPDSLRRLAITIRTVWLAGILLFVAITLVGPALIRIMTPRHFHPAAPLVPYLAIGFLAQIVYMLMAPEIWYAKKTHLVPLMVIASVGTNLLLTMLLVKPLGALGVAIATSGGLVVSAIIASYMSSRLLRIPHYWKDYLRVTATGALAVTIGLLLPIRSPLAQVFAGVSVMILLIMGLWAFGDPTLRQGFARARRHLSEII